MTVAVAAMTTTMMSYVNNWMTVTARFCGQESLYRVGATTSHICRDWQMIERCP